MPSIDQLKTLFKQLNSKNIVYNKAYYKVTGSVAGAVLLSHLVYLFSEVFGGDEFYQSDAQLGDSLGFSVKTLRTAKESIREFVTATKRGIPAKNHWVIHEDKIIDALLSLPAAKKRGSPGISSHAENGTTVAAENGTTGHAENGTCNNKELHNNKELTNNNNSVALGRIKAKIQNLDIHPNMIESWLKDYTENYIISKIDFLLSSPRKNPVGWLISAIEKDYKVDPSKEKLIFNPASHEPWSPELQAKRDQELEARLDPNDWREQMRKKFEQKMKNARIELSVDNPVAL